MRKSRGMYLWGRWFVIFLAVILSIGVTSYYFLTLYRMVLAQEREVLVGIVKRLEVNFNTRLLVLQFLASDIEQRKLDREESSKELVRSVEVLKFFNARIFDRNGKITAEAWRSLNTVEVHDRESFNQALVGNSLISDVIVSEEQQRPYVSLRVPIYYGSDQVQAVLAGGILLEDLRKLIEMERLPLDHYLFIKDSKNRAVYYPIQQEGMMEYNFFRDMQIDCCQNSNGIIIDKSVDDEKDLIYISSALENSNWHVVMVVPLNQLYITAFWRSGYYMATLCLIVFCIGLLYRNSRQARFFEENIQRLRMERLMSVNQLAASLAHEVRNPLTTIKGFVQLMARKLEGRQKLDHVEIILNEIDGIDRLLSEFQSLTLPLKAPNFIKIDVERMVKNIVILMHGQAAEKKIQLTFCYNKGGFSYHHLHILDAVVPLEKSYVLGDETQLKQVLINLLKNAIDATSCHGNIEVLLSSQDDMIGITVKDNGIGMPRDVLEKIGTPFFTTKEGGNGIGLSVCYNIIASHGGRIEVDSEVGKGTAFVVKLPWVSRNIS